MRIPITRRPRWTVSAPKTRGTTRWGNKEDEEVEQRCLEWVRDFRRRLAGETEGPFINFPDLELATDRKELLTFYYGKETLADLIQVKQAHDPNNLFDFPMGIPTS